ncbi:MAG: GNAT family N-acetyltransferase [Janthinobacterium lividum]
MSIATVAGAVSIRVADEGFAQYVAAADFGFIVSAYADPQIGVGVDHWQRRSVEPYRKCYGIDPDEFSFLREDSARGAIFVAWLGERAVGHVVVNIKWNGFAHIEELVVDASARRRGVARQLIDVAGFWARKHNLPGIMLETQSNNLAACQLYERYGFVMGGVDHWRYRGIDPHTQESAIFWYLLFP